MFPTLLNLLPTSHPSHPSRLSPSSTTCRFVHPGLYIQGRHFHGSTNSKTVQSFLFKFALPVSCHVANNPKFTTWNNIGNNDYFTVSVGQKWGCNLVASDIKGFTRGYPETVSQAEVFSRHVWRRFYSKVTHVAVSGLAPFSQGCLTAWQLTSSRVSGARESESTSTLDRSHSFITKYWKWHPMTSAEFCSLLAGH